MRNLNIRAILVSAILAMGLIDVSEAYAAESLVAVQLPKTDLLVNEKIQFTVTGPANDQCTVGRLNSTQTKFTLNSAGRVSFTYTAPNTVGSIKFDISCAVGGTTFYIFNISNPSSTQIKPTPAAVTPTPAATSAVVIPGTTVCWTLGAVMNVNNRKVTCAQNQSIMSRPPRWQYISSGTLCYIEGLFVRPWKCRYQYINNGGRLTFQR